MKRRVSVLALALCAGAGVTVGARSGNQDPTGATRGVWSGRSSRWRVEGSGTTTIVQLQLQQSRDGGTWSHSFPVPLADLAGLTAAQAESSNGLVRFEVVRDAGSFAFEGSFVAGQGAGHFVFTPRAEYREELRRMGYGFPDASQIFTLATHDVSRALIRELAGLGYTKLSLEDLLSLAIHGATPAFIRELGTLGYAKPSVEDLVSLRIHGATPAFIRELKALGYARVSVEDLVSLRIHGATPAFVRELKALGYSGVPVDDLVSMRIHGVTPEFVRSANRDGKATSVERLVEMRIHGEGEEP